MDFNNQLDPSTITDVETAKLALRWAIEKIHALSDDNARLKEDNRNKVNIARQLTQQGEQKDEILKKWQATIKTWEENWKTQTAMEADLKGKLREQILNEETANWRQARAQLETEIKALKHELAYKEAEIGKLKLYAIDEIRKAAELKDEETQAIILNSRDSLVERENAVRAKYERFEKELIETLRVKTEQEELALQERYEVKMREFSRLYQAKEAQLEDFRRNLEDDYIKKAEALTAERTAKLKEEKLELTAKAEAAMAETDKEASQRVKTIETEFDKRRADMRAEFEERERALTAEKDGELAALKETDQKELTELRGRLRQYILEREQDYVDLRLTMEAQLVELVKKHDEASAAAYREAARATKEQWSRLAIENQKKLDAIIAETNARWEADWTKREDEMTAQREPLLSAEKGRLAAEFKLREEALRKTLLREQNEWAAGQAGELEKAKMDLEKAHEEKLELVKISVTRAYAAKERALEDRLAAAQNKMRNEWLVKEEEWAIEKDHHLIEEKEKLREEFSKCQEETLKLKTAELEKQFPARLQAEKQRLAADFELKKRELAEETRRHLCDKETALSEKLERKGLELLKNHEARTARLAEETAALERAAAHKEAALAAKEEDLRADFINQLKTEKLKIEESYNSRELHLKAGEDDLENLKNALHQQHNELKIKLYQELQAKESEQSRRLAQAKEGLFRDMNGRRDALEKEYETRLAGIRTKEASLQEESDRKTAELEKNLANREKMLNDVYADKLAKVEAECAMKMKGLLAGQESELQRRREELETLHNQQAVELEKKYSEMTRVFNSDFERQRADWEVQRAELAEKERQALRTETEKRAAALNRKLEEEIEKNKNSKAKFEEEFGRRTLELEREHNKKSEEELSRNKDYKIKLEEEFDKRRQELEQKHYKKLEESRSTLEKMRKEHEARLRVKFNDMEAEQNRLTMWVFQKEDEYTRKYANKETELLQQWGLRERALRESYEKKIKELEAKLADGKRS